MLTLTADHPLPFTDSDTWQAVTGLDVIPFSDNCTPTSIRMTSDEYPGAKSAFDAYKLKNKAHKRRNFLAGVTGEEESFHTPGCKSLKTWVHQNWTGWGLAAMTKQVLTEKHYDFYQFHKDRGRKEVSKDEWCMPTTLLIFFQPVLIGVVDMDVIYNALGDALFGPEGRDNAGLQPQAVRAFVKSLVQARWESQSKAFLKLQAATIEDDVSLEEELESTYFTRRACVFYSLLRRHAGQPPPQACSRHYHENQEVPQARSQVWRRGDVGAHPVVGGSPRRDEAHREQDCAAEGEQQVACPAPQGFEGDGGRVVCRGRVGRVG